MQDGYGAANDMPHSSQVFMFVRCASLLTGNIAMYRRSILAMILMLKEPEQYDPSANRETRAGFSGWDFSRLELEADYRDAVRVVNRIMGVHALSLDAIRAELRSISLDYIDASKDLINLDCLRILELL